MKYIIRLLLVILCIPVNAQNQSDWVVPDDKKGKLSDFAFSDSTNQLGAQIYQINCRSCHGDPGKGNYQNLNPLPGDPATDKIQHNLDGELFYKLQEGRGLMPSFKNILSQKDIWMVISYLRSFNDDYVQEVAKLVQRGNLTYADLKIILTALENHQLRAQVTGDEKGVWNPVPGADVELFVHRYFGHLAVDEVRSTNEAGEAVFNLPADLPGDTSGMIMVMARLADEEAFGEIETDTLLPLGVAVHPVPLTAKKAMWNTMRMAPTWLLLTYGGALLIVLGLIGYVLLLLRKIFYSNE